MANAEHVNILKQGVEVWNKWRDDNPEIIPSLSGADLHKVDLPKAVLFGVDLAEANLVGADLLGADLRRANLSGADLDAANLSNARLRDADFSGSILHWTIFIQADLLKTKFGYSSMGYTVFADVDLSNAKGLETVEHLMPSAIGIDTIYKSKGEIPEKFLRGAGVPENFITYMGSLVDKAWDYYSCFISYSHDDQDFTNRLYADLQDKGVRTWVATEDLKIGDKFVQTIDQAIRLRDKLLVVLSENSIRSDWVANEVEMALEEEKRRGKTVLFPIRLDDAVMDTRESWAAMVRRNRHIGDFRNWKNHDDFQKAFERLLRDLQGKA